MKPLNPELTAQVSELADMIGRKLNRDEFDLLETAQPYVQALARGGYARMSDINLQVRLESMVTEKFAETAIHRRREISAMAGEMQQAFERLVSMETSHPPTPAEELGAIKGSATN